MLLFPSVASVSMHEPLSGERLRFAACYTKEEWERGAAIDCASVVFRGVNFRSS